MDTKKQFNLKLPPELIAELKHQAIREGRSISDMAIELFREYLRKVKAKKS